MRENLTPFPTHLLGLVRKINDNFTIHQEQKITNAAQILAINGYFLVFKPSKTSTSESKITDFGSCRTYFFSIFYIRSHIYHVVHLLVAARDAYCWHVGETYLSGPCYFKPYE
jgi:hypothetical protein